jgi:dimethylglycine dehydrogenase
VEHQYIVTEPDPALVEWRKDNPEHPVLRDADAKWYVREERGGWILGPYERGAPARFEYACPTVSAPISSRSISSGSRRNTCRMIHRIPSSETVGLKDDYNGPICYTPDGNPLVGPAPGLRNMWLAEGFSFGITAAGGTGYYLAQMMVEGEAEIDMASLDPKRYGSWMTTEYAARKNEECYEHVYILHHPDEEREACRPLRTAPAYDRQKARARSSAASTAGSGRTTTGRWMRPTASTTTRGLSGAAAGGNMPGRRPRRSAGVGLIDATAFTKHLVGAGRHGLPRSFHLQQAAEGRADQPDLRADQPRHDAHRIHHRAAGRGRVLPRLRRGVDGL